MPSRSTFVVPPFRLPEPSQRVETSRLSAELAGTPMWLNGAPGARIYIAGELAAAVSLTVENGRIIRIYSINNPHKLGQLDAETALAR
jgi:RNA polymerase sigma-70 factor (ECF subfamily)